MITVLATFIFVVVLVFIVWLLLEAMYLDYYNNKFRDELSCGDTASIGKDIVTVSAVDRQKGRVLVTTLFDGPVWVDLYRITSPYEQSLLSYLYHQKLKPYIRAIYGKDNTDI